MLAHSVKGSKTITFRNDIIDAFEPRYKSISKDQDRYFNALVDLSENGIIETTEVIQLSGKGALWIAYRYIDKELFDLVEADLMSVVTSRDFFGPLFENTRLVLERLLEVSESDRVIAIYRAAIKHRLKAVKAEVDFWKKTKKAPPKNGISKRMKHYVPPLKNMIKDYKTILALTERSASEVEGFEKALKTLAPKQHSGA